MSRNHLESETSMNAISSLRSGKVLPNILLTKEKGMDEEKVGDQKLDDKIHDLGSTLELDEANERGKE